MEKYNRIMEYFWMVAAILSFLYAIYLLGATSLEEAWVFFIMPLIAGFLFAMRRYMRKKMK